MLVIICRSAFFLVPSGILFNPVFLSGLVAGGGALYSGSSEGTYAILLERVGWTCSLEGPATDDVRTSQRILWPMPEAATYIESF